MHDVVFRGTKDGLVIILNDDLDFAAVLERLAGKLTASGRFFRGAEVEVATGKRHLSDSERLRLADLIEEQYGLKLREIREGETAATFGTGVRRDAGGHAPKTESADAQVFTFQSETAADGPPPMVITRTLRSGQMVHHRGDVIIIGDVNPGAEVIATGHIIVFGILRGVAHAGAEGNEAALVAALRVQPTQLRIGRKVGLPPEEDQVPAALVPEVARIEDGRIVISSRELRYTGS